MTEVGVGLDRLISLRGKRALITGAAAGIGRAIAGRFAEAGASLLLVDIHRDRLSAARGELSESADVEAHAVDVSQREQRDRLWQAIAASYPDILVNNAGIYPFRHFLDMDQALYEEVMAVNLDAVYWMCQEFIRARGDAGGVILNLGSIEALLPFKADLAHYSVSKAGVVALTRALAKEHGGRGFRVNALLPGGIVTEGTRRAARGLLRLKLGLIRTGLQFKSRLPIGRAGQPDEVARVALALVSDLGSYVHGAAIPVDGGFLAA